MSDPKSEVRDKYAKLARSGQSCCGDDAACADPVTAGNYSDAEKGAVLSLGCGNPVALADLHEGETVLDLGSGAGLDVLLSAKRVGPAGRVYGLDMTDDMLALAQENQRKAGATNVVWLRGEIESIPLPAASVDVVLSNCVINLSTDKARALAEAFRVLRPGGRLAIHDIVTRGPVAPDVRARMEASFGCMAGALDEADYRRLLAAAGFTRVEIVPTREYEHGFASAFVRGFK